jgi:hypothetical protein
MAGISLASKGFAWAIRIAIWNPNHLTYTGQCLRV